MELDNLGADERLQKYEEFNTLPEVNLGGIEYISNKLPEMNENIDYTSMLSSTASPLLPPPRPIRLKQPELEIELGDNPNFVAARPDGLDDLTKPKVHPVNSYEALGGKYKDAVFTSSQLKSSIAGVESGGKYNAHNKTPGSTAVGKYQFIYRLWGDSIKRVTGVKNMEEFKASPQAQEDFFDYYEKTTLRPQLATLKKEFPNSGLTDLQLMKLLHFRGLGDKNKEDNGARHHLREGNLDKKTESNNLTVRQYLNHK